MNPDTVRRLLATRTAPPPVDPESTWGDYLLDRVEARIRTRRFRLIRHGRTINAARLRRHSPSRAEESTDSDRGGAARVA
jgi:hypothetical protein